MGKKRLFLQFENMNGLSIKNPYLNSFVCLCVFIVGRIYIERERAMEVKLNEIALNRSRNHSEDK